MMRKIKLSICCFWLLLPVFYFCIGHLLPAIHVKVQARGNPRAHSQANILSRFVAATTTARGQESAHKRIDYAQHIKPIFSASCYSCHAREKAQGGLRLDTEAGAMKGGESGASIIPGNSRESILVRRIHGGAVELRMPPSGNPLNAEQLNLIKTWIDQGAEWPDETSSSAGPASPTAMAAVNVSSSKTIDFVKDVQPIFQASCYQCHAGEKPQAQLRLDAKTLAMKGGVSGAVIIPGKSAESRLVHRVLGTGDEPRMPLKGAPLSAKQIATLSRWIDEGEVWPERSASDTQAKLEKHWAFIKPERPTLPGVKNTAWARNPIDKFILARLEKEKLTASSEAAKEILIRRLSLDLTGLPPTLEEVDRFIADRHQDAYEKLVDRLLASPHYGERWGRQWLDAARYADSNGFEKDSPRSIWPYRDWVINAFNRDMPFDQFTVEQLAGDLLPNSTLEQRIATGFLRNSMLNEEGGVDPEQFRVEGVIDRVDAVGKAFLGLTINCAQCHTHKFDPISHKEYYQLYAFLNSDSEPQQEVLNVEEKKKRDDILSSIAKIEDDLIVKDSDLSRRIAGWEQTVRRDEGRWTVLEETSIFAAFGTKFDKLEDHSFIPKGDNSTKNNYTIKARTNLKNITGLRLELLTDPSLPRGGPGRAKDGSLFLSELIVEAAPHDKPEALEKIVISNATADFSAPDFPVKNAIDGDSKTAWSIDAGPGRRNQDRKAVFEAKAPIGFDGGTHLVIQLTQKQADAVNIGRFRLSVTTDASPHADLLPSSVRQIISISRAQRTPAQHRELFSFYRTTDPQFAESNKKIDEQMKE